MPHGNQPAVVHLGGDAQMVHGGGQVGDDLPVVAVLDGLVGRFALAPKRLSGLGRRHRRLLRGLVAGEELLSQDRFMFYSLLQSTTNVSLTV